jgi:hypothetical protein
MFSGDFEIHLTGSEWQVDKLAAFAARRGVKFSHIQLHQGMTPSQPMLTVSGSGTLVDLHDLAARWRAELAEEGLRVVRVKIEAAPWNEGVPRSDEDARDDLYFEHHVKVRQPTSDPRGPVRLMRAVVGHDAHVSINARRTRAVGFQERFVTQRCHGVGRSTARARLDALLAALHESEIEILEVEEEYVVHDDALHVDRGWLNDPNVKGPSAKPEFDDAADEQRWRAARRVAMAHVLAVVAASPWAENLVLRGSAVLPAWLGEAAREPDDLDFVVTPQTLSPETPQANAMMEGLVAAVAADPGPGLRADQVVSEHIWTYERVPGRRLMFPFDVEGLPQGVVPMDLVFNEPLAEEPVITEIPPAGTLMRTASAMLSLAWKLDWLMADDYPQGKDLYDAMLLAEYLSTPRERIRALMRPESASLLEEYIEDGDLPEMDVFRRYSAMEDEAEPWLRRLAAALGTV